MWKIQGKVIGPGEPVFLVAEAGVNHNGDIDLAHRLIDAAVDAGADAVKFQTFITEEVVSKKAPLAGHHLANIKEVVTHFDLIKKLELPFTAFTELKEHCEERNVVFISTPYDILSAEFLIDLGADIIKIASSELVNLPLLDVVRTSKIPVILSTGMSTWAETAESVDFVREYHESVCILKCTSNYPASPGSINLNGTIKIRQAFPSLLVGFSDHSEGSEVSLTAVGIGISVIERHFTLDKNAWGPDHKASMLPDEFRVFVRSVRKCEKALGSVDWDIQDEELIQRQTMRKGVYTIRKIRKGEQLTNKDVRFLRPSMGLSPKEFYLHYSGKIVNRMLESGQIVLADDFAD